MLEHIFQKFARYGGRNTVTALTGDGVGPELLKYVQEIFRYIFIIGFSCFSYITGNVSSCIYIFTKTCPCYILQFSTAVKKIIFR